ncbi:hypothetical protein [Thioclava sp. F36-6]|uniref:hypothetical protein n=1 Tax=Thioclava sp. F36-6 TaxID=1915316 RepID=UPI0009975EE0|nr:hypothetical protein [Thioclava sp. F36-6]OOY31488.1 hypothetical protein BMI88_10370 [Thioclava sp. F36-6]
MNQTLGITIARDGARLKAVLALPAPSPVEAMMLGKTPEEVAELMPRLFNLCGMAQGLAVRLATGLEAAGCDPRREILRDHLSKLCLRWPAQIGHDPMPLPADWSKGGAALQRWIWGGARPSQLADWLSSGAGISPLLAAIAERFAPGEAVADLPDLSQPLSLVPQENSAAGRMRDADLMRQAEARYGRGPLWRALGRVVDLDRLCFDRPPARHIAPGVASVAAARGAYTLQVRLSGGRVSALTRITPTDHLTVPGGMLQRSLESLPAEKVSLASLVVDILDPCVPVLMREVADA